MPKSHGKIRITGVQLRTMGLTSIIHITPIELEIMQSLPELDIKLTVPGGSANSLAMLSSEQLIVYLDIKNISNEPLGRFSFESNPEVACCADSDLNYLKTLKANSEYTLPIVLSAFSKSTEVKFIITYSNSEGKISLNTDLKIDMEVKEGVSVAESRIEPLFEYPWQKNLKDVNPSMSEKGNAFPGRFEDVGNNDNPYCLVKFKLINNSKDSLGIIGQIKDSNETKDLIIGPNESANIELVLLRIENPSEEYLNEVICIEWRSLLNTRRGNLSDFKFTQTDLNFAKSTRTSLSLQVLNEKTYSLAEVTIDSQDSYKGLNLYFYPLKITQEGIKLIPHDLIIAGCLALPLHDNEKKYHIKFMQIGQGEFVMVIGIGNKSRITCWSHKIWNITS